MRSLSSGQPKQAKTETGQSRNKCPRKAEALAETEASDKTFISVERDCFGRITVSVSNLTCLQLHVV